MSGDRAYLLKHVKPLDVDCPEHKTKPGQPCSQLHGTTCERREKVITEGWQTIEWVDGGAAFDSHAYYYVEQADEDGIELKQLEEYDGILQAARRHPEAIIGDSTLEAPMIHPGLYGAKIRSYYDWSSKTLLGGWTHDRLDPVRHLFDAAGSTNRPDICAKCGHEHTKHWSDVG